MDHSKRNREYFQSHGFIHTSIPGHTMDLFEKTLEAGKVIVQYHIAKDHDAVPEPQVVTNAEQTQTDPNAGHDQGLVDEAQGGAGESQGGEGEAGEGEAVAGIGSEEGAQSQASTDGMPVNLETDGRGGDVHEQHTDSTPQ